MSRAFVAGIALALVTGVAAAAPLQRAHTVSFRDAAGEHPAGPDITTVRATSDGTALTLAVTVPSTASFTSDMRLRVWLDADHDRRTGLAVEQPTGLDHFILVDPTLFPASEARLYRCTASVCSTLGTGGPSPFSYASGATLRVDAAALGLLRVERVRFRVALTQGIAYDPLTGYDFTNARIDTAPNEGEWAFDARALRATSFRATPTRPRAGEPFALSLTTIRTETGAAPAGARATCSLSVGGRPVRGTARVARRTARCSFVVPAGTRGQHFRATIRVRAAGASAARSISGRVA